jgi:hypothetical protein
MRGRLAVLLAVVLVVGTGAAVSRPASGDVTTVSRDVARTGWSPDEPKLTPAAVTSSSFGQLFSTAVDGQVYGQPLVVKGTLIAATENDKVYGLDPETGAIKWTRSVGPFWPASAISCGDLVPNIGITSAPVYDSDSDSVYFTAKVNDGADLNHPHYYLHAVDPATGAERSGWPVTIQGSPSNDSSKAFNPKTVLQRPGLLLMDGVVYMGFGSHCDKEDYRGYVAGVSTTTHSMTSLWTTEAGASNSGSGIWHAGGGIASDGAGRMFVSTGNGVTPPVGVGTKPPGTLSESVVRLQVNADKTVSAADFFAPANANTLDDGDTDLASGGPVVLPDALFSGATHPHVVTVQGKDGRIFLLDRDDLGGRGQGAGGGDNVLGVIGPYQGQWGHPAAWTGDGGYVYAVGNGGPLRAFKAGVTGAGNPSLSVAGTSTDTFPYTSGSPVITSDGTKSGSGVVWVVRSSGSTGTDAQLRAYGAVPDGTGRLPLLWSAPIGTAVKFTVPATDGGRVYVGTRDGRVIGFGSPANTVLTGSPLDFGDVTVGTKTTKTLTLTATKTLTVSAVSAKSPFAVTAPALPVTLNAGDQLQLPVTYTAGDPGAANGILSVTTDQGTLGFSLNANTTQPGLQATPAAVSFPDQAVGASATVNVQIRNTGTADETVSDASGGNSAAFTVGGLPDAGSVIPAGGSVIATVTYKPTTTGYDGTTITVNSTSGKLTIPISGTAVSGSGKLVVTPTPVNYGTVAVGSSRTLSFDLVNTGNLPLTISLAKAPATDFATTTPLSEGIVLGPGQVVHQKVTFKPTQPGAQTAQYLFNANDGGGVRTVNVTGTGTGVLPRPNTTDWSVNGATKINATAGTVTLTPNTTSTAGTYIYKRAVPTAALHTTFTTRIGPGTGGAGLSFFLLDPSVNPASVGKNGGGLGFLGLKGVCVCFNATQVANNVGIATGTGGSTLSYIATAKVPSSMRTGDHAMSVMLVDGSIQVRIDGKLLLNKKPPAGSLGATALPGWGAATGSWTDQHMLVKQWLRVYPTAGSPLTANPASVDFPETQIGSSQPASLVLQNTGGQQETVQSVTAPGGPFTATLPAVGKTINAGGSITIPLTFKPTDDGTAVKLLTVRTTGGTVVVPVVGTGEGDLPDLTTSTWSYAGTTTLSGTTAKLTADGQTRSAALLVNSMPVTPQGVTARFTTQIAGSALDGADGMTFALLDASAAKPTVPGIIGGGLGIVGLSAPATYVAFETYPNAGVSSKNYVAIGTSTPGQTATTFTATNTDVPALRNTTHPVEITITSASHIVVKIDGTQVLDKAVTLPSRVRVAFTAGTGALTDTHAVLNPVISYTS